jgi:YD repeat-containing protein
LEELASYSVQNLALSKERWLAQDYKSVVDWNQPSSLEPNSYLTAIQYDALGRIKAQTAPDGRIIIPAYNERGLLLSEEIDDGGNLTDYLKEMRYDARGQRSHAEYHNGVYTRYTYDTETFRLTRLLTRAGASILQDLNYTYDPVGNITLKKDDNIPDIFYANQQVHPAQSYTYDALYRLTEATGREHMGGASFGPEDNWDDAPFLHQHHQNDNMPMQNYTQHYVYDEAGKIIELRHQAATGSYTRDYQYSSTNNQLRRHVHLHPRS